MFNLTKLDLEERDLKPFWYHVKTEDGDLAYADEKKKKPIRIKISGIEDEALELAAYVEYKKLTKLKQETDLDIAFDGAVEDLGDDELAKKELELLKKGQKLQEIQAEFAAKVITEWEGFSIDSKPLECSPVNVYHVFVKYPELIKQLKEAIKEKKGISIK